MATVALFAAASTAFAQTRETARKDDRSQAQRSSQGKRHAASRGSVRYNKSRSDSAGDRSKPSDLGSGRSARSAPGGGRSGVSRRSSAVGRSYHPTRTRHRASGGTIRHHRRPYQHSAGIPSRGWDRNVHVRHYPRYGTRIDRLPPSHRVITYHGSNYYFHDGVYYRPYRSGVYRVVRPPIGVHLSFLPSGYTIVEYSGRPYYRYENTYYVREIVNQEPVYVVVEPPQEIIIDELPFDTREVYVGGNRYFVDIYEEVAYAPVIIDGYTRYRQTSLDVDVDIDDGRVEIEIDD
jgi:hypothetical protein